MVALLVRHCTFAGALVMGAAVLCGCGDDLSGAAGQAAVGAPQTCYRLPTGDPKRAVVLSGGDGDLMTCAMHVEAWRLMNRAPAAAGLYQGQMVYASREDGITSASGPQAPRFHVYTPGQQADIDAKVQILIARRKAGGGNETGSD